MAGNDREETRRPGYALKKIVERLMDYKDYKWTWTEEELKKLDERAKEIEQWRYKNLGAGIGKEEEV